MKELQNIIVPFFQPFAKDVRKTENPFAVATEITE
jgi:hypothetical protein|tara:strand:+ start:845 stop:949 length:105 start_codon:yes stop_codon:yes gene_type:complete